MRPASFPESEESCALSEFLPISYLPSRSVLPLSPDELPGHHPADPLIYLAYVGAVVLAIGLVLLGIRSLREAGQPTPRKSDELRTKRNHRGSVRFF